MWGVSESREPIKGKFAEKVVEELRKIYLRRKEEAELKLKNKKQETFHNIIKEDDI
jgi:hypothetical protein